jgi:hypothetical protein
MAEYDLYGFFSNNLKDVAKHIEQILQIDMTLHESAYLGGDYYRSGISGQEEFILQRNYDESDDGPAEQEFSRYTTLLYVGPTQRSSEIKELIIGAMRGEAVLLRHEIL